MMELPDHKVSGHLFSWIDEILKSHEDFQRLIEGIALSTETHMAATKDNSHILIT